TDIIYHVLHVSAIFRQNKVATCTIIIKFHIGCIYSIILSFANLSNNCFCPNSLKKIVALRSGRLPSILTTLPNPNRSCSTSIPTCKLEVSEGAKPADGTCALGKIEVIFCLTIGFGLENVSVCCCRQTLRSFVKEEVSELCCCCGRKSRSKYCGSSSSMKRLGSQLFSVPHWYREVA